MKITHYIPVEIVDLIADYHDYDKYCKPKHQEKFKEVMNDIGNMASIMPTIMPNLAWQCWGSGSKYLGIYDVEWINEEYTELLELIDGR